MSDKQNATTEQIINNAANETVKEFNPTNNTEEFVKKVYHKFVESKLYDMPMLFKETRRVNYLKYKELREQGNEQGWSESKDFKHDYVIPKELYNFMVNMVYKEFWAEENEKVWRSFMKRIIAGDDAGELLRKIKIHYLGANKVA